MNPKKATRARSPEKKLANFKKIIEIGKRQLAKHGTRGLSLRSIAKQMNMGQTNIYNYVQSKRELWILIRSSYYNEFLVPFDEIIKNHVGDYLSLYMKLAEFFLDFAGKDYNRFEIMFLISAPPSKKKGPYERAYEPFQITKRLLILLEKAIEAGDVRKEEELIKLNYQIFSMLIGAARMEADLKDHFQIIEPFDIKSLLKSPEDFRNYVLKVLETILKVM